MPPDSRETVPARVAAACRRAPAVLLEHRFGGVVLFIAAFLALAWATRLALLLKSAGQVSWDSSLLAAGAWGMLFDLAAAAWWTLPLTLALMLLPRRSFNQRIVRGLVHLTGVAILALLIFGAAAEWFFWDEFGVRFNFIAVDYLVYTSEVIGNIRESYPLSAVFTGIGTAAVALYALGWRTGWGRRWLAHAATGWRRRYLQGLAWCAGAVLLGLTVSQRWLPDFRNNYNRELGKNGLWSFFAAFRANELDFDGFYATLPPATALQRVHEMLDVDGSLPSGADADDLLRVVRHPGPERRLNVVQITVESLSASFLTRYGNPEGLTPNLDALLPQALVFDNFYATGNRTVRGMEALTLSVPPTPGRSMVKRPQNQDLFTLGSIFQRRGYDTAFIYSGYGYFDNMNAFFGGNGYRIVDRATVGEDDVTFGNIWGACDEDLYRWTMREADADFAAGKPFYYFVMTTSNHRPYTFPDHRIDLASKVSGRPGGVKYTDYAIGDFLRKAAEKPWFKDTIFVIVADHCASSAGRTELPVQNYHIPLIIYAPGGQVTPGYVSTLCSQIDYAPTLLGLLHWTYASRFFGYDVLGLPAGATGRALIGNYQRLGLYRDGKLAVLKPLRETLTLAYDRSTHDLTPTSVPDRALVDDAIAYYETASHLFKHARQGRYAGPLP